MAEVDATAAADLFATARFVDLLRDPFDVLHAGDEKDGVRAIARLHLDLPDARQPLEQSLLVVDVVNLDQLNAVGDADIFATRFQVDF